MATTLELDKKERPTPQRLDHSLKRPEYTHTLQGNNINTISNEQQSFLVERAARFLKTSIFNSLAFNASIMKISLRHKTGKIAIFLECMLIRFIRFNEFSCDIHHSFRPSDTLGSSFLGR